MEIKKEIFWKYKDAKIEIDLIKFAHDRYATISVNREKIVLPCYVMEALIDTWHENELKIKL
jgi:hypothetical protein